MNVIILGRTRELLLDIWYICHYIYIRYLNQSYLLIVNW